MLGYAPCHHMAVVNSDDEQKRLWRDVAAGRTPPDWHRLLGGFRAAVDWPSAFYWRELAEAYPDAKVILTVRDAQDWLASMKKTIFPVIERTTDPDSLGKRIGELVFGGNITDREHVLRVFTEHIAKVQESIAPTRLLTFDAKEGWEPLCAFLECEVPSVPYPSRNSAQEFNRGR